MQIAQFLLKWNTSNQDFPAHSPEQTLHLEPPFQASPKKPVCPVLGEEPLSVLNKHPWRWTAFR